MHVRNDYISVLNGTHVRLNLSGQSKSRGNNILIICLAAQTAAASDELH